MRMCYAPGVSWSRSQIDGFALAAIAFDDRSALLASRGLARRVAEAVTARACALARETPEARRAWLRRTLAARTPARAAGLGA